MMNYTVIVRLLLITLLCCPCVSYTQDISGIWIGNYGKSLSIAAVNKLEVELEMVNDSVVSGQSRLFHGRDQYEVYKIRGVYRPKDSTLYFSEKEEVDINIKGANVPGHYNMKLTIGSTLMRMEGRWQQHGSGYGLLSTNVWLEKALPISKDTLVTAANKKTLPIKNNEQVINRRNDGLLRESKLLKTIAIDTTDADSITIEIIDNAKLDHDVISLYINDELVFDHKEISYSPLTHHLSIPSDNPECTIKMVANSCGAMPPCTARMNIITPRTTFPVTLESNYSSNGVVVLKLKL